jgi:CDP-diacylglycerol--glycerol-3-phosphate 3-phosphatidyltransferase
MIINKIWLPNLLTIARLVISPLLLPFLIVYLVPLDYQVINFLVGLVFFVFCLTDFFDGHYARKFDNLSKMGSLLDPIADKFLIYATLISLVAIGKVYFFWAIVLIGREFFVMGVRLIGSEHQIKVPVVFLAKCKTVLEMVYIGSVIIQTSHRPWFFYETIVLCVTFASALISAYQYTLVVYHDLKRMNNGGFF